MKQKYDVPANQCLVLHILVCLS